jgi:hypothetical protein
MVFFAHGAFGWENGLTVKATVKTATSRMVQADCFIDDIFPHLNTLEIQQQMHCRPAASVQATWLG